MRNKFSEYLNWTEKQNKQLWEKPLIIFDTNILLELYKQFPSSANNLFQIFKSISEKTKLWIPFQVAKEFFRNQDAVIKERNSKLDEFNKKLDNIKKDFNLKINNLNIKKEVNEQIQESSKVIIDELDKIISCTTNFQGELLNQYKKNDDSLLEKIVALFQNNTGDAPENQKVIDSIYDEGERRYNFEYPPGYKDQKETKYMHKNIIYQNKFGDLVIWKQILEYCHKEKYKNVIFVTNDEKEDWVYKVSGQKYGARPELIREIMDYSEVNLFEIYNLNRFLELIPKYMDNSNNCDLINKINKYLTAESIKIDSTNDLNPESNFVDPNSFCLNDLYKNLNKELYYSNEATNGEYSQLIRKKINQIKERRKLKRLILEKEKEKITILESPGIMGRKINKLIELEKEIDRLKTIEWLIKTEMKWNGME